MSELSFIAPQSEQAFAQSMLDALGKPPPSVPSVPIDENKCRNAARCITEFLCARLAQTGDAPVAVEDTTFRLRDGLVNLRNAVRTYLWTNLRPGPVEHFRETADGQPSVYLMTAWHPTLDRAHVWAVPEKVVFEALQRHRLDQTEKWTVEIHPDEHRFRRCDASPDLSPFYRQFQWSNAEREKLVAAVKIDEATRRRRRNEEPLEGDNEDDSPENENRPGYSTATVEFVNQLPSHVNDESWHEANKDRYQVVLRDPTVRLVELLRSNYVERLSPEVAGGKQPISRLKKNDFGRGGYRDHYWCAFFDPDAGSRTRSVQLFFMIHGGKGVWQYGVAMGEQREEYLERLQAAWKGSPEAAASYLRNAPEGTVVTLSRVDDEEQTSTDALACAILRLSNDPAALGKLTNIDILREFPIDSLPEHDDNLVVEVGEFFTWAWPFFASSVTGQWPPSNPEPPPGEDVDEDAPVTLEGLSALTSLPVPFLEELEEALLAKQQAVLVGPPGTSKTYIARQFARYFVAQHAGRSQGNHHVLYMHANWTYEDFFEGIKPVAREDGQLTFERQKGLFLEWVEQLRSYEPGCRHVLVLDEINRCETAAVFGELLQLLEYRESTIRLLSGRNFVLPRNLFIIGTMNSADRSIGRLDFALRRRFMWLNLHPQPDTLQRWLNREGNNPAKFDASSLAECNALLATKGIPVEQHVGHALFMTQETRADEPFLSQDVPLTAKHLRRVVQFSVVPYVQELFINHFGQPDEQVTEQIRRVLLACVSAETAAQSGAGAQWS